MTTSPHKERRRLLLKKLIDDQFEGVHAAFAERTGIDATLVSRYLKGSKGIGERMAERIEKTLGLPGYFVGGAEGDAGGLADLPHAVRVPSGYRIPVVGHARLGDNGHFVELEYPVGHGDGYIDMPSDDPNAYALLCRGDSMAPRIQDGEYVIIEPNRPVVGGDEVLVKAKDGRVMVKKYLYTRDGRVHLVSVNHAHPPITFDEADIEKMHFVLGAVKRARWRAD